MKNLKLILMVVLALTVSSKMAFAEDTFGVGKLVGDIRSSIGSGITQVGSGITGLRNGDIAGVVAGINNFMSTTPGLSQVYGMGKIVGSLPVIQPAMSGIYGAGQWTGTQLNNIYRDLGTAYSTGGLGSLGGYVVTAPFSGAGKIGTYGAGVYSSTFGTGITSRLVASASRPGKMDIPGAGSPLPYVAPRVAAQNAYFEKRSSIVSGAFKPVKF